MKYLGCILTICTVLVATLVITTEARGQNATFGTFAVSRRHENPKVGRLIQELDDSDIQRRDRAAIALMAMHPLPPEALAALGYPLMYDHAVQKAMGEAGRRELASLTLTLEDQDYRVREGAVHILAAAARQQPNIWPVIAKALGNDNTIVGGTAADEFRNVPRTHSEQVVALIRAALRSDSAATRRAAMDALRNFPPARDRALPELSALLKDPDPNNRHFAAAEFADMGRLAKPVENDLCLALKDSDRGVAQAAAYALAQIDPHGAKGAVPVLIEALGPAHTMPLWMVADALGTMGADAHEAVPALVRLLTANRDDGAQDRREAALVLGKIPGEDVALPLSRALADDKAVEVRQAAGESLKELHAYNPVAVPYLIKALGDENGAVRNDATDLLVSIGHAAVALGKLGKPATPALIAALKSPDLYTKEGAIEALGRNQPLSEDVVRALTEVAFKDESKLAREDAATALSNAKIAAGDQAEQQLQKDQSAAEAATKKEESAKRWTKEAIVATLPADADHEYPMQLESLMPIADGTFLVTLHRGEDRPDLLRVWRSTGKNEYQFLRAIEAEDTDQTIDPPLVFRPKGQPVGEQSEFLYVVVSARHSSDEYLFAINTTFGRLERVEIESPADRFKAMLRHGESFSEAGNVFVDLQVPAFSVSIEKDHDRMCCPSGGEVDGSYRIVVDRPRTWSGKEPETVWRFIPEFAIRKRAPSRRRSR